MAKRSDGTMLVVILAAGWVGPWAVVSAQTLLPAGGSASEPRLPVLRHFVNQYCVDCHSQVDPAGQLTLDTPELLGPPSERPPAGQPEKRQPEKRQPEKCQPDDRHQPADRQPEGGQPSLDRLADNAEILATWERVVRKLRARQMPPAEMPRPREAEYQRAVAAAERLLDEAAARRPRPGRTSTFRRLTRGEYQNAIRDLLALEIDAAALLPPDSASHGFDNVTVSDLSPTRMERYLAAAERISRLAIGLDQTPGGVTFRVPADRTQEQHVEGLPLGTRGGLKLPHQFPRDGQYEVRVRLARDRNEHVEGLHGTHELVVLLDRKEVARFTVRPPEDRQDHELVDQHLEARIDVLAGPHQLGVTFVQQSSSLLETMRQPYQAHFNMHRHPRLSPAVYQVSVTGPFSPGGPGDTPSRRRIFSSRPTSEDPLEAERCAREIFSTLARRAYRRAIGEDDLNVPLRFYREAREEGGFEQGIQAGLAAILVNPNFLLRIERDPEGVPEGTAYPISQIELASRLSFFLWSSIPDDELLEQAIAGQLRHPDVLEAQVRRMLADDRAQTLATQFAGQWLYLRNLDSITPDLRMFPDFDDNLRLALREETERFFASILREDRSVLDLLDSDYTFLNERLAAHYGIPHVRGSRFRRVSSIEGAHRGGLLRQGSLLTVTSYATRTSPVIRGHWILKNLLGTPPPPPPPNVPALEENTVSALLSVRERLAAHRANEACSGCHNLMDPPGFALEHYDAIGRWRELEAGEPVDASGGLPDGSQFVGAEGLQQALLARPELFVGTLSEKLLTFALGRGMEPWDGAAIRQVVREAKADDYRFSSLILALVRSTPFQQRSSE